MKIIKRERKSNTSIENTNDTNSKSSMEFLLFIAINVLLVGISTWQTFVGYKADVAGNILIAAAIALASGFMFFALNFGIRERMMKGENYNNMLLMYIIPLGISFFGNFNAFYSNQTESIFLKEETRAYRTQLTGTYDEASQAIEKYADLNTFERNYASHLEKLKIEFNNPPKGWGREAEKRWVELIDFLNEEGGSLSANVLGQTKDQVRYDRALANADRESKNISRSRSGNVNPIVDYIFDKYEPVNDKIESLTTGSNPDFDASLLDDIVEAENAIRTKVASFLNKPEEEVFSTEKLTPNSVNEAGTIQHTLKKAFIEWEIPSATLFSLFFSLIIDLAALLYIIVFYKKPKNKITTGLRGPVKI